MNVLIVEPKKAPYEADIGGDLADLQGIVGGSIEAAYFFKDPVALICNEEGKINGMELNRAIYGEGGEMLDIMAGTFLMAGLGDEDFTSLPPDLMVKYKEVFASPEEFIQLGKHIATIPIEPQAEKGDTTPKLSKKHGQEL